MMKLKRPGPLYPENPAGRPASAFIRAGHAMLHGLAALSAAASVAGCTFDTAGLPSQDGIKSERRGDLPHKDASRDMFPDSAMAESPRPDMLPAGDAGKDSAKDAKKTDFKGKDIQVADKTLQDSIPPCPASSTGIYIGKLDIGVPVPVGGYSFTYAGADAKNNALFDISCGGNAIEKAKPFALNVQTTLVMPQDSKKILITPYYAYGGYATAKINVDAL